MAGMMYNPPHPGRALEEFCGIGLDIEHSVTEAAEMLGIDRAALLRIINGQSDITAAVALKIAKRFGGSPRQWLRMQMEYDLYQAETRSRYENRPT